MFLCVCQFANISLFEEINLQCDLRPNRYVENDRTLILTLWVVHQNSDFDCVFPTQTQLVHENTLFRLEPSEVCFERILYVFLCVFVACFNMLTCCAACRRRLFSGPKGGPRFCGHVQIEKSVFYLFLMYFMYIYEQSSLDFHYFRETERPLIFWGGS